jgi:hypothetical protein
MVRTCGEMVSEGSNCVDRETVNVAGDWVSYDVGRLRRGVEIAAGFG